MTTGETTTTRVSVESRDEWWATVHAALDGMDDEVVADHRRESGLLDNAAADGLHR